MICFFSVIGAVAVVAGIAALVAYIGSLYSPPELAIFLKVLTAVFASIPVLLACYMCRPGR